tara:strand:- start:25 stop:855 length:831 start_codon:yes stop_codon:yes gene_type:complete
MHRAKPMIASTVKFNHPSFVISLTLVGLSLLSSYFGESKNRYSGTNGCGGLWAVKDAEPLFTYEITRDHQAILKLAKVFWKTNQMKRIRKMNIFKTISIAAALVATPAVAQSISDPWEMELNESMASCAMSNTSSVDMFTNRKIQVTINSQTGSIFILATLLNNPEMSLSNSKTIQVALRGTDTIIWQGEYKVVVKNGISAAQIYIKNADIKEFTAQFSRANHLLFAFDDRVVDRYALTDSSNAVADWWKCANQFNKELAAEKAKDPSFKVPRLNW